MGLEELNDILDSRKISRPKGKKKIIEDLMEYDFKQQSKPEALSARLGSMKRSELQLYIKRCRLHVGNTKNVNSMKVALQNYLSSLVEGSAFTESTNTILAESSEASTNESISVSSATSSSADAPTLASAENMKMKELREWVDRYNLVDEHGNRIRSNTNEPLRLALRKHLSSLDAHESSSLQSSDSGRRRRRRW